MHGLKAITKTYIMLFLFDFAVESCDKSLFNQGNISTASTIMPANSNCTFQLTASNPNQTIALSIYQFISSSSSQQCTSKDDYIEIYDGEYAIADRLIARICQAIDQNQFSAFMIASTTNMMTVIVVRRRNSGVAENTFQFRANFQSSSTSGN